MRYIRKYYEICKKTLLTGSNATGSRSHTKIMRPRNYTAWLPQGLVVDRTKHLRTGNMEISWRGILSHWKWVRKTTTIRYTKKKQPRGFSQTQAKPANEPATDNQKNNKWKSSGSDKADDAYLQKKTIVEGHSRHLVILIRPGEDILVTPPRLPRKVRNLAI